MGALLPFLFKREIVFNIDVAKESLNRAKVALMCRKDTVFFTTTCFSLKHIWDDTIPTACTNGTEIRFNPSFFIKLDAEERLFLLLHETLHVAYLHMDRLGSRNGYRWNVAADHVINLQLIKRGYKMPKGGLADKRFMDMGTEQVYALLPEDLEDPDDGSGNGSDLKEPECSSEELQEQVKEILVRAATQSKNSGDAAGTIPGEIEVFLEKLLKPKLPWNRILQKYLNSLAKTDYSFRKPNRRFLPKHYLPSLHNQKLIDLEIAVDISGSVTSHEFLVFVSEVASIFRMMKPEKITLVQFDTEIKSIHELRNIRDLLAIEFKGRGGTRIGPVIERANEVKPQLLMVFTDGVFSFREYTSKVNTIWVIHDHPEFTAPFGKVIHYSIEGKP